MSDWTAGHPHVNWTIDMPITVVSGQNLSYVTSAIYGPSDPTGASVAFAFIGPYSDSTAAVSATISSSTTWITGSWGTTTSYPTSYIAQCLVGPGGAVQLASGVWAVYVRWQNSPEIPAAWSGPLVVN